VTEPRDAAKEAPPSPPKRKTFKDHAHWLWREWIKPLLVVGLVLGSFRSAIADWNDVPSGSMKPTILEGDRVFVNKIAYDLKFPFTTWRISEWSNPQRGDVVVLYSPHDGRRLIKRVVGIPGDSIEMKDHKLIVNGVTADYAALDSSAFVGIDPDVTALEEKALEARPHPIFTKASFEAVKVPPGSYLVMGDNRDNSFDSRFFGFVQRTRILGRATAVVLSVQMGGPWWQVWQWRPRWGRFFTRLE
jgi:signal peptidase I